MLVGALLLISSLTACGEARDERKADRDKRTPAAAASSSAPPAVPLAVVPGTKKQARKLVKRAEERFLENASGHFAVQFELEDYWEQLLTGEFDLVQPAGTQTFWIDEETRVDIRQRTGHVWTKITAPDIKGTECWIHLGTDDEELATAAAVPPPALLLFEPVAVGMLAEGGDIGYVGPAGDDVGERVVVDLLLEEAAPITLPITLARQLNQSKTQIDPTARIRGMATIGVNGRFSSIEYPASSVLDALEREKIQLPDAARMLREEPDLSVRVDFHDYGTEVVVKAPRPATVMDLGAIEDAISGTGMGVPEPCAAAAVLL